MKYDTQLSEVSKVLPNVKNILIVLPSQPEIDHLAAGLSLFLSLKQMGKEVAIVTEGVIKVGHANLFGIGQVQNKISSSSPGGNFTITLGGVVALDKTIPAVSNLDWAPTGAELKDLKLIFHAKEGQKFEPTFITPAYEGGGFDLIFVLGASSLDDLGGIYTGNAQIFSGGQVVNLTNKEGNQFGSTNIIDLSTSSLSEIVSQTLSVLGLPLDQDIASNLLAGIFSTTDNLQNEKVGAETYEVAAMAVRAGGQKPAYAKATAGEPTTALAPEGEPSAVDSVSVATSVEEAAPTQSTPGLDLSGIFGLRPSQPTETYPVPPIVSNTPGTETEPQPSPEERPIEEGTGTISPEDDWLTPKIFRSKGSI